MITYIRVYMYIYVLAECSVQSGLQGIAKATAMKPRGMCEAIYPKAPSSSVVCTQASKGLLYLGSMYGL